MLSATSHMSFFCYSGRGKLTRICQNPVKNPSLRPESGQNQKSGISSGDTKDDSWPRKTRFVRTFDLDRILVFGPDSGLNRKRSHHSHPSTHCPAFRTAALHFDQTVQILQETTTWRPPLPRVRCRPRYFAPWAIDPMTSEKMRRLRLKP
mmetsp:Transcript_13691/g.42364  ORF Transcript_13691/g.42364 Transcript_13691/m.42364 type:complete len:150 (+) Transcript_13691:1393-1842(+)